MPITANVTNEQITASVGETQIDVTVSGGIGPTGPAGAGAGAITFSTVTDTSTYTNFNTTPGSLATALSGIDSALTGKAGTGDLVLVAGAGTNSIKPAGTSNTVGNYSVILAGDPQLASGVHSVICGGSSNSISGDYSSVLGGTGNDGGSYNNVHLIGSYITAAASDYTLVNNLHIVGAWNGSALAGGVLKFPDGTTMSTAGAAALHAHSAADVTSGVFDVALLPVGTGSTQVAAGNHTHTQLHDRSHAITSTSDHTAGNWKVFYSNGSGQVVELALGSSGQYLTANGTAAAPTFTTPSSGGSTNVWIPASAFIPRTTAGAGVDSREQTTNTQNTDELTFDPATAQFADAMVVMPSNYNAGTVTARFYWTGTSGSGDCVWRLQGVAIGDNSTLDVASGTAQSATDTYLSANVMHVSPATSAITFSGTPAANKPVQLTVSRDATNAADTYSVSSRLLGVEIAYTAA